ncbi:MAG: PqqD family protein [Vicinamibacterales bacterium]
MTKPKIPVRDPQCLLEHLDENVLIYHPRLTKTIHLNQSAAIVWDLCDGTRSVQEIADALVQVFPDAAADIREDVDATLQRFADEGAIEFK